MPMKFLDVLTAWLVIAAGLHLGLAVFGIDLVARARLDDLLQKGLFGLMGVAAVYQFVQWRAIRRRIRN